MNVRHDANRVLAAVQTALRSGEWIPAEDSLVKSAVPALQQALMDGSTMETISYHFDRLAELVGAAVTSGEWMPGEWASEWQGYYVDHALGERIEMMKPDQSVQFTRLAA